jgi:hypothetical protein
MISMSSIKVFKFKAFVVTGVATLGAIATQPAQAITGFTGPYAPANWSFTKEALGNKVVKRSLRSDLFLMNVLGAD